MSEEDPTHSHGRRIWAPFSAQQVQALNLFQNSYWHPFTCAYRARPGHGTPDALVAAPWGWHCPDEDCDFTQQWAHDFMADLEWVRAETARMREVSPVRSGPRPESGVRTPGPRARCADVSDTRTGSAPEPR